MVPFPKIKIGTAFITDSTGPVWVKVSDKKGMVLLSKGSQFHVGDKESFPDIRHVQPMIIVEDESAYAAGYRSFEDDDNPYPDYSKDHDEWERGRRHCEMQHAD